MDSPYSHIGRVEIQRDWADADRVSRLAAVLDHAVSPWPRFVLPPLGHWLCFLPSDRQSALGEDGHPMRNDEGLLPNVDLPRRMWAGSRIRFLADIPLDTAIVRKSTLIAMAPKSGRSGTMLFATVRHEISVEGGSPAVIEEQDIVYREALPAGSPYVRTAPDPGDPDPVARSVTADPILLFRYSALTFNGHRIHYDRDYARAAEGYPGLVVQGPLIATLMLDLLVRQGSAPILGYSFRAASPIFDGEPINLGLRHSGGRVELRAIGPAGVAMTGSAEFAS